jgi:hypothetical protein
LENLENLKNFFQNFENLEKFRTGLKFRTEPNRVRFGSVRKFSNRTGSMHITNSTGSAKLRRPERPLALGLAHSGRGRGFGGHREPNGAILIETDHRGQQRGRRQEKDFR